jgi:hypothetical protein
MVPITEYSWPGFRIRIRKYLKIRIRIRNKSFRIHNTAYFKKITNVQGFTAEYSLTACPHNCSGRGVCGPDGACRCSELYAGPACTVPLCPDLCGVSADRGRCDIGPQGARCICNAGFAGDDCSLDDQVDCSQMPPILIAFRKFFRGLRSRTYVLFKCSDFLKPDLCVGIRYPNLQGSYELNQSFYF